MKSLTRYHDYYTALRSGDCGFANESVRGVGGRITYAVKPVSLPTAPSPFHPGTLHLPSHPPSTKQAS